MKHLLSIAAIALLAGCKTAPENGSRSTLDIVIGTNRITSSTPKEYKIKKLQWNADGFTVEGLDSAVNVNAVEAQTAQAQLNQQSFGQTLQLLQFMSVLANQKFGGGSTPPQIVTNYVQLPPVTNSVPAVNAGPIIIPGSGTISVPASGNLPTVITNK